MKALPYLNRHVRRALAKMERLATRADGIVAQNRRKPEAALREALAEPQNQHVLAELANLRPPLASLLRNPRPSRLHPCVTS